MIQIQAFSTLHKVPNREPDGWDLQLIGSVKTSIFHNSSVNQATNYVGCIGIDCQKLVLCVGAQVHWLFIHLLGNFDNVVW